jgi:hypothetical protein
MTDRTVRQLASWEKAWLDWAHPIVQMATNNPCHLGWCEDALGPARYPNSPNDPASNDPTLRWPGYVGSRWRPGRGILFVGSVHSDFSKEGRRSGDPDRLAVVQKLADANRRWRDSPRRSRSDDLRYLTQTREGYVALIPGWNRDGAFAQLRSELSESLDEVAWTNLAHCRAKPRSGANEYLLQKKCSGTSGAYPIGDLVTALRPLVVLACIAPLEKAHGTSFLFEASDGFRPQVWCFRGDNGKRHGRNPSQWVPEVAHEIRSLRQEPQGHAPVPRPGPDR